MARRNIEYRVRAAWPDIVARSRVRQDATDALPRGSLNLLGSSLKVEKGRDRGYLVAVQYLSPSTESGRNTCPFATKECAAACLGHNSGQLAMPQAMRARVWKTALRYGAPDLYFELLDHDIARHVKRAKRAGLRPAVRLDGSSDLGDAARVADQWPGVTFYDYTKTPARARRWAEGRLPANYHVCLSFTGYNRGEARRFLENGGTVAVVFNARPARAGRAGDPLPDTWEGAPVADGDKDDLRFLDPAGHAIGLRFKAARQREHLLTIAGPFVEPA